MQLVSFAYCKYKVNNLITLKDYKFIENLLKRIAQVLIGLYLM